LKTKQVFGDKLVPVSTLCLKAVNLNPAKKATQWVAVLQFKASSLHQDTEDTLHSNTGASHQCNPVALRRILIKEPALANTRHHKTNGKAAHLNKEDQVKVHLDNNKAHQVKAHQVVLTVTTLLNREDLNREDLNREDLNREALNREDLNREALNREDLNREDLKEVHRRKEDHVLDTHLNVKVDLLHSSSEDLLNSVLLLRSSSNNGMPPGSILA
jgi:hypothetical protein